MASAINGGVLDQMEANGRDQHKSFEILEWESAWIAWLMKGLCVLECQHISQSKTPNIAPGRVCKKSTGLNVCCSLLRDMKSIGSLQSLLVTTVQLAFCCETSDAARRM